MYNSLSLADLGGRGVRGNAPLYSGPKKGHFLEKTVEF